jgi:hypothetical protein
MPIQLAGTIRVRRTEYADSLIQTPGDLTLVVGNLAAGAVKPFSNSFTELGSLTQQFKNGYLSGTLSIGLTTAAESLLHVGSSGGTTVLLDGASNVSLIAPSFAGRRAKGTLASKTAVASGNLLAIFSAQGWDGSNWIETTRIQGQVGTFTGTDDVSGEILFQTRPTGSGSSLTERAKLSDVGKFSIFTPTTSAPLNVPVLAADPASPANGDVWIFDNGTTRAFKFRSSGVTYAAVAV